MPRFPALVGLADADEAAALRVALVPRQVTTCELGDGSALRACCARPPRGQPERAKSRDLISAPADSSSGSVPGGGGGGCSSAELEKRRHRRGPRRAGRRAGGTCARTSGDVLLARAWEPPGGRFVSVSLRLWLRTGLDETERPPASSKQTPLSDSEQGLWPLLAVRPRELAQSRQPRPPRTLPATPVGRAAVHAAGTGPQDPGGGRMRSRSLASPARASLPPAESLAGLCFVAGNSAPTREQPRLRWLGGSPGPPSACAAVTAGGPVSCGSRRRTLAVSER